MTTHPWPTIGSPARTASHWRPPTHDKHQHHQMVCPISTWQAQTKSVDQELAELAQSPKSCDPPWARSHRLHHALRGWGRWRQWCTILVLLGTWQLGRPSPFKPDTCTACTACTACTVPSPPVGERTASPQLAKCPQTWAETWGTWLLCGRFLLASNVAIEAIICLYLFATLNDEKWF